VSRREIQRGFLHYSEKYRPNPCRRRVVVAVGDCGCTGGIFGASYASCGRVSNVITVDVAVPGCPPTPLAIMQAILTAIRSRKA